MRTVDAIVLWKMLQQKKAVIIFLPVVFLMVSFSPVPQSPTLIIAEYDPNAATNHIVHLISIPFTEGIKGPQHNFMDVITQQAGDPSPRIRFDFGPNQVYRNRWIITAYGNVIDMQLKKILVDQHDQFIRASGDSIIFYTNDIIKGKYYSVLDLKTGIYAQVTNPLFKAITGKDVEPDCTNPDFKIFYYPPSAPKIELVRDAGFGEDVSLIPGAHTNLPIFWLDNDNFLYPKYSSHHDFVSIMKYSMNTKSEENIGDIDQLPENHALSKFYRDADGNIVYSCARGLFQVDAAKKKVVLQKFISAGNGFSISADEFAPKGRIIQKDNSTIGNYYCDPSGAASAPGCIAFPFGIKLGDEQYAQGAAVWASDAQKWQVVGDSDLAALVGWTQ